MKVVDGGGCWPERELELGTSRCVLQQQHLLPQGYSVICPSVQLQRSSLSAVFLSSSITVGILEFPDGALVKDAPKNDGARSRATFPPHPSQVESMAPSSSRGPCDDRYGRVPWSYAGTCASKVPITLPLPPFRATRTFPLLDKFFESTKQPTSFDLALQCAKSAEEQNAIERTQRDALTVSHFLPSIPFNQLVFSGLKTVACSARGESEDGGTKVSLSSFQSHSAVAQAHSRQDCQAAPTNCD